MLPSSLWSVSPILKRPSGPLKHWRFLLVTVFLREIGTGFFVNYFFIVRDIPQKWVIIFWTVIPGMVTKKSKPRRQCRLGIPEKVQGDSQLSDERNMTFWCFQIFSTRIRNTTAESSKSVCPLWQECMILHTRTLFSTLVKWTGKPSSLIASL